MKNENERKLGMKEETVDARRIRKIRVLEKKEKNGN